MGNVVFGCIVVLRPTNSIIKYINTGKDLIQERTSG